MMERRRSLELAAMAGLGAVTNPADLFAQQRFLAPMKVAGDLALLPRRWRHGGRIDFKQAEIVRAPIKEPVVIRDVYDLKNKAYRTNIT